MARSIGPILAVGAITITNQTLLNGKPIDMRVPVATVIAASAFALLEKGWEDGAVALSYLALLSVLFVRLEPNTPAPVESALKWWESGGGK